MLRAFFISARLLLGNAIDAHGSTAYSNPLGTGGLSNTTGTSDSATLVGGGHVDDVAALDSVDEAPPSSTHQVIISSTGQLENLAGRSALIRRATNPAADVNSKDDGTEVAFIEEEASVGVGQSDQDLAAVAAGEDDEDLAAVAGEDVDEDRAAISEDVVSNDDQDGEEDASTGVDVGSPYHQELQRTAFVNEDAMKQCINADTSEYAEEARLGLGQQLNGILEANEGTSKDVAARLAGIRSVVHPARVMAVIKDHEGDEVTWAQLVMGSPQPPEYLGVSWGRDAFAIRKNGLHNVGLLVLYPGAEKPERCQALADANIEIAVTSVDWLEQCRNSSERVPKVHLFVDTGHGYVGVLVPKAKHLMKIALSRGFEIAGIMSHLCCSGWGVPLECALLSAGRHKAKLRRMHATQKSRISRAVKQLMNFWKRLAPASHPKPLIHVSPSGPITKGDSSLFFDMVRPGRMLLQNAWDHKERARTLYSYGLKNSANGDSVKHEGAVLQGRSKSQKVFQRLIRTRRIDDGTRHGKNLIQVVRKHEPLSPHVRMMLTADVEKILPAGWCMGYYCQNEQGRVEVLDRPMRVGIPHFLVEGHEVSDVDKVHRCSEQSSGRNLPLLDSGPYGLVMDLTLASRIRPLAIECTMNP